MLCARNRFSSSSTATSLNNSPAAAHQHQQQQSSFSPSPRRFVIVDDHQNLKAELDNNNSNYNDDDDPLLNPSRHYKRFAKELHDKKHNSSSKNVKSTSSKDDESKKSKSKSQEKSDEDDDQAEISKNNKFSRKDTSHLRYITEESPQDQQERVAVVFASTKDRLSYFPNQQTVSTVRKITSRQEAQAQPDAQVVEMGRRIGLYSSSNQKKNVTSDNSNSRKFYTVQNTATTKPEMKKKKRSGKQPQTFISVSPARHQQHFSTASTTASSMFSVPFSDESRVPMSHVVTHPAAITSSSSPFVSPSRREILDSMQTAEWISDQDLIHDRKQLLSMQQQRQQKSSSSPNSASLSRINSSHVSHHNHNQHQQRIAKSGCGTSSSAATSGQTPTTAMNTNNNSSNTMMRENKLKNVISQQLAYRYLTHFRNLLATSGLTEARWFFDVDFHQKGDDLNNDDDDNSFGENKTTNINTTNTTSFSAETRDAYMREWKCCALMRRVILENFDDLKELAEMWEESGGREKDEWVVM